MEDGILQADYYLSDIKQNRKICQCQCHMNLVYKFNPLGQNSWKNPPSNTHIVTPI